MAGSRQRLLVEPDVFLIGLHAPELIDYQSKQVVSNFCGRNGYLKLKFAKKEEKSILREIENRVPLFAQKALYWDEEMPLLPCVPIISTSGCILQNDRLSIVIDVEEGASAHITTQSATKIHSMDNGYAAQTQLIRIKKDAYLEYIPDLIIPHRNSRFINETLIRYDSNATLIYTDILMSGRKHHHQDEHFGFDVYSSKVILCNNRNEVLFIEKMVLKPKDFPLNIVGVMGDFDVYGNAIVIAKKLHQELILSQLPSYFDQDVCYGISTLPYESGLIFKVLAKRSSKVKQCIRNLWGIVRKVATGCSLPPPFLWKG